MTSRSPYDVALRQALEGRWIACYEFLDRESRRGDLEDAQLVDLVALARHAYRCLSRDEEARDRLLLTLTARVEEDR